jgi:exopolysaccharide biosynthesis polyprenyl glycosylphosphotransferase
MSKKTEKIILLLTDFVAINLGWLIYYYVRIKSGLIAHDTEPELWLPMFAVYVYWFLVFFFFGMYREWYAKSRFDELVAVLKAVTFGTLVLFFIVFIDMIVNESRMISRLTVLLYWLTMVVSVGAGRAVLRSVQRKLLESGIGLRNTLIVGSTKKSRELYDMVVRFPALGYKVVGFIRVDVDKLDGEDEDVPVFGDLARLGAVVEERDIKEVLIALDSSQHDKLLDVVTRCDAEGVGLKIMPDMYDIISGQARTNQIYGFPLIEIMPELMPEWERSVKRLIDLVVSLLILLIGLPIWIIVAAAIKLDSKGPVFYKQERVGKEGKVFTMFKFRSMVKDAEKHSGPQWAEKNDPRITRVGRIIRRLHFDEVPQFINVLDGDMSLVGPRPERPFFVRQLSEQIPLYSRRLKVRPGITGWAQVKHKYDETLEDVKAKLQYDLFYIENISIRMDMKILLNTVYSVLARKGH